MRRRGLVVDVERRRRWREPDGCLSLTIETLQQSAAPGTTAMATLGRRSRRTADDRCTLSIGGARIHGTLPSLAAGASRRGQTALTLNDLDESRIHRL